MITISESAADHFRELLTKKQMPPETALRVGIKGGGCSGFSYVFDLESQPPGKKDQIIQDHGVTVIIDKKSALFLMGTMIDYDKSLMREGFVFRNPQAKTTCGCGTSFSM